MIGTGSYTTSTTNMYNNTDFTYRQQQFGHDRRITGRAATNTRAANEYGPYEWVKKIRLSEKNVIAKNKFRCPIEHQWKC